MVRINPNDRIETKINMIFCERFGVRVKNYKSSFSNLTLGPDDDACIAEVAEIRFLLNILKWFFKDFSFSRTNSNETYPYEKKLRFNATDLVYIFR